MNDLYNIISNLVACMIKQLRYVIILSYMFHLVPYYVLAIWLTLAHDI